MEIKNQPKLIFHGVNFPAVHFDCFARYDNKKSVDVSIVPKVFYPDDDELGFHIVMQVNLVCEKTFNLSLSAVGEFRLDQSVEKKDKTFFVNLNAPAIMFPYVRAFVSTLTGNIGNILGCLTIPTKFFAGELEEISKDLSEKK